jgi:hypothetical protein
VGTDTNELKQGIARTRGELGRDVDALAEKVTPSRIAERRMESMKAGATGLRDKVMGTAEDAASSTGDLASSAADAVGQGGRRVARAAEGNPIAAGLLVFAAGWLISSLIPVSEKEKELGGAVRDAAESSGLTDMAAEMAGQVKDGMAEEVRGSAEHLKETAMDAAHAVQGEARDQMPEHLDRPATSG